MGDAERLARESEFHDQRFSSDEGRKSRHFYSITSRSADAYRDLVAHLDSGSEVLELGCGDHAEAWALNDRGLTVTAIDISAVAVEEARDRAARERRKRLTFEEMNAEQLPLPDSSFDAVLGAGILHHLDLGLAVPEIARVMRPGGVGVFLEPLGLNPVINMYRRVTPGERTPDEHPLLRRDLEHLKNWFESVELQFFHLASLAAIPLLKSDKFEPALSLLERADERILRRNGLAQDLAWFVTIRLSIPKAVKAVEG